MLYNKVWEKQDSNLRRCKSTGLQPVAFDRSAILPLSIEFKGFLCHN